jgi:hypothetical protein
VLAEHAPPSLQLDDVRGTVLSGSIESVRIKQLPLGRLTWHFAPLGLLRAELSFDVSLIGLGHRVQGRFGITPLGTLVARQVTVEWPLRSLSNDITWGGQLSAHIDSARLHRGWPEKALGSITVRHFTRPDSNIDLGSFTLDVGAGADAKQVEGHLRDIDGPLAVQATVLMNADRSYRIDGSLLPREGTPEDIKDSFTFLGPPDTAGRRAFQMAGTL